MRPGGWGPAGCPREIFGKGGDLCAAIAQGYSPGSLRTHQIVDWINQDPSLQASGDSSFRAFFAQLVDSARRPLTQAADRFGQPIEALEIAQVIQWFEQVAKQNLEAPPSEG
jgi:hypothetical protein